jgi:hypothetical protein
LEEGLPCLEEGLPCLEEEVFHLLMEAVVLILEEGEFHHHPLEVVVFVQILVEVGEGDCLLRPQLHYTLPQEPFLVEEEFHRHHHQVAWEYCLQN